MDIGRWCVNCEQVWQVTGIEVGTGDFHCPACGGKTRPERRNGLDRRSMGTLYRVWDPESRIRIDRRRGLGDAPA